jgi:cytochrome b561
MTEIKKYPKPMIAIHWLTVILLAIVFIKGKGLEDVEFNESNMNQYRVHALLGMALLILTVIRLFVKKAYKNSLPPEITYYSDGHKTIVNLVNKLLYVFLILTPLFGFIMIFQTGAMTVDFGGAFPKDAHFNETLEVLHKGSIFILVSLVVTHVVGVILYKIKTGENLVRRICKFMK